MHQRENTEMAQLAINETAEDTPENALYHSSLTTLSYTDGVISDIIVKLIQQPNGKKLASQFVTDMRMLCLTFTTVKAEDMSIVSGENLDQMRELAFDDMQAYFDELDNAIRRGEQYVKLRADGNTKEITAAADNDRESRHLGFFFAKIVFALAVVSALAYLISLLWDEDSELYEGAAEVSKNLTNAIVERIKDGINFNAHNTEEVLQGRVEEVADAYDIPIVYNASTNFHNKTYTNFTNVGSIEANNDYPTGKNFNIDWSPPVFNATMDSVRNYGKYLSDNQLTETLGKLGKPILIHFGLMAGTNLVRLQLEAKQPEGKPQTPTFIEWLYRSNPQGNHNGRLWVYNKANAIGQGLLYPALAVYNTVTQYNLITNWLLVRGIQNERAQGALGGTTLREAGVFAWDFALRTTEYTGGVGQFILSNKEAVLVAMGVAFVAYHIAGKAVKSVPEAQIQKTMGFVLRTAFPVFDVTSTIGSTVPLLQSIGDFSGGSGGSGSTAIYVRQMDKQKTEEFKDAIHTQRNYFFVGLIDARDHIRELWGILDDILRTAQLTDFQHGVITRSISKRVDKEKRSKDRADILEKQLLRLVNNRELAFKYHAPDGDSKSRREQVQSPVRANARYDTLVREALEETDNDVDAATRLVIKRL